MADLQDVTGWEEPHRRCGELLPWYLNGTLEPKERREVEAHLGECPSCRLELEELRGLREVAAASEAELPASTPYGALLKRALEQIRARHPQGSAGSSRRWGWRTLLRPRWALAFSLLAIAFMGLGVFVGLQLGLNSTAIGELPAAGERAYQTTEQYFAFPREILLQGTFTVEIGDRPLEEEAFTLERLEDGKLLLTSNIQAGELAAFQRLKLDADLRPLSYRLQGPLVYRGSRAEADFSSDHVTLSLCCTATASGQQVSRRIVPLQGFPVLDDFSVMSHFALIYQVISNQLQQGISFKELELMAITPQALRAEALQVEDVRSATLESQGRKLPVMRYLLAIGSKEPLRVLLYGLEEEGTLLAISIPTQPRLASSAEIFAYRSDLYPQGLGIPTEGGS